MSKRPSVAKSAGNAAIVIAVITMVLVLYIALLPASEREALLEDGGLSDTDTSSGIVSLTNKTLLVSNIGRLEYFNPEGYDHNIPPINLFAVTEASVLEKINPFYIKNSLFGKQYRNASFRISDLENTQDVILSFSAPQRKGKLIIKLNGNKIYDYEINSLNPEPVKLKKEYLGEYNELEFSVSGVGAAFWRTNEYALEDVKVIGDITDISRQKSSNAFTVSSSEKYNIERAQLVFFPSCKQDEVGLLNVHLNNRMVYSAVPDCNTVNIQELYTDDINVGRNNVVFVTEKGNYRIDQIIVDTDLKETSSFIDYFEIDAEDFSKVLSGRRNVLLEINFVDDRENKRGEISVNGHLTRMDQKEPAYIRDITPFVGPGNNYIELVPSTTLNIVELKVSIE